MRRTFRRLTPVALLVLAVAAGLGLAACGDDGDAAVSATGPDEPVTDNPNSTNSTVRNPAEPGRIRPDGSQEVRPEPGVGQNVRMRPFDRAEVAADGASVDVFFYGGVPECYTVDRIDIDPDPSPGAIELTLFEGTRPGANACIEIAVSYVTTVSLAMPVDPAIDVVDGTDGLVKS